MSVVAIESLLAVDTNCGYFTRALSSRDGGRGVLGPFDGVLSSRALLFAPLRWMGAGGRANASVLQAASVQKKLIRKATATASCPSQEQRFANLQCYSSAATAAQRCAIAEHHKRECCPTQAGALDCKRHWGATSDQQSSRQRPRTYAPPAHAASRSLVTRRETRRAPTAHAAVPEPPLPHGRGGEGAAIDIRSRRPTRRTR